MALTDSLLLDGRVVCSTLAAKTYQEVLHKQIFMSKASARVAADRANAKYKPYRKLTPYVCEHCGYWHNGRLAIDVSTAVQEFVVVGAGSIVFYNFALQARPLAKVTEELLRCESDSLSENTLIELRNICFAISQPFELSDNGWVRVLRVGPEYWAVLNNLHAPNQNQVVMRVENRLPLLCRYWRELPDYSYLWHHSLVCEL